MAKRKYESNYSAAKRARKAGYRRKRMYRSTRGRSKLVPLIKRTILKMAEPKHKDTTHDIIQLYHNSGSPASGQILHTARPIKDYFTMPLQGDNDRERNGDHIWMKGISVKLLLGQKADRMNVTFRVCVLECTSEQEPATYGDLVDAQTGNSMLDSLNTDRGKIVYQKYVKKTISPQLDTYGGVRELTHFHKFWIPHKKLIKFSDNSSNNQYSGTRMYLYVFAYDAYGTLLTDNIAYFQAWSRLYYRDP